MVFPSAASIEMLHAARGLGEVRSVRAVTSHFAELSYHIGFNTLHACFSKGQRIILCRHYPTAMTIYSDLGAAVLERSADAAINKAAARIEEIVSATIFFELMSVMVSKTGRPLPLS